MIIIKENGQNKLSIEELMAINQKAYEIFDCKSHARLMVATEKQFNTIIKNAEKDVNCEIVYK